MNIFTKTGKWLGDVGRVFVRTFINIKNDAGALLFFLGLPLLYPIIYTLIYNPELVRQIPVAVVDESLSAESRSFVQKASASPTIQIYAYCPNMADAKALMAERKVYGVMYIPSDYARKIATNDVVHVQFYSDMSLLLRYRAFVAALADLQMVVTQDLAMEKAGAMGMAQTASEGSVLPVQSESNFLGDPEQGFASFVIPGIVVLILQQSMLLGICLLGGSSRERRRRNGGSDPLAVQNVSAFATIWGRTLCFVVFYLALTIYNLRIVPMMFQLPHYGNAMDYMLFIFPMLLAVAFLGQGLVVLMRERESAFLLLVVTSVVFLFLSGLTWPRYAMGEVWYWIGNLIPATWGVEGFIRINSNAATLAENSTAYIALWILAGVYMLFAWWSTRYVEASQKSELQVTK